MYGRKGMVRKGNASRGRKGDGRMIAMPVPSSHGTGFFDLPVKQPVRKGVKEYQRDYLMYYL